MPEIRRPLQIALRAAVVVVSVLLLCACVVSEVRCLYYQGGLNWQPSAPQINRGLLVARGRARYWRYEYDGLTTGGILAGSWWLIPNDVVEHLNLPAPNPRLSLRCFKSERGVWGHGVTIDAPLWPLAVTVIGASAWALRGLRRRAAGCCRGCGYDLAGLTADLCPECGAATGTVN
jgi:hypothetical protein